MRLQVGQNSGCFTREWHTEWSWLKLILSPRAAENRRIGIEIKPKVRWPFQTVVAIRQLLLVSPGGYKVSRVLPEKQGKCFVSVAKDNNSKPGKDGRCGFRLATPADSAGHAKAIHRCNRLKSVG